MQFQFISCEYREQTAIVVIEREPMMNALNERTITELLSVLDLLDAEKTVRGVILSGRGDKAFAAGADIKEFLGKSPDEAKRLSAHGHALMNRIERFGKPIVAAINGYALGGGLELALACHLRIASTTAKFALPEVSLGLIPGYGGTRRLAQLIGKTKAMEMVLTGDMIDANQALNYGLLNQVVAAEELIGACELLLERCYKRSPNAIRAAIQAIINSYEQPGSAGEKEIELFGKCFGSADFTEGVNAFLEKRKPKF